MHWSPEWVGVYVAAAAIGLPLAVKLFALCVRAAVNGSYVRTERFNDLKDDVAYIKIQVDKLVERV